MAHTHYVLTEISCLMSGTFMALLQMLLLTCINLKPHYVFIWILEEVFPKQQKDRNTHCCLYVIGKEILLLIRLLYLHCIANP